MRRINRRPIIGPIANRTVIDADGDMLRARLTEAGTDGLEADSKGAPMRNVEFDEFQLRIWARILRTLQASFDSGMGASRRP